jgi:ferredoxin-fold anticodon binding domain-containing protein
MKNKKTEADTDAAAEILDELVSLLDQRVSDLYEVKGTSESRHAYIFYRSKVWDAIEELEKNKLKS